MACRTYTPGSIPTHALRNDFFLKNLRDIHIDEHLLSRISSKCSVEAIKNTTFCKLPKLTKGFRPMGSGADRSALHFKMAPHLRGRLDVAYVHLVRLPIILRALTFLPLPNLLTTKIGLWGEESEMGIVLLITKSEYPLQIIWLYLT